MTSFDPELPPEDGPAPEEVPAAPEPDPEPAETDSEPKEEESSPEPESDEDDSDELTDLAEVLEPDEDFDSAIQELDADEDEDEPDDDDVDEEPSAVVETMNGSKDDLKQIKGVGPAIEKTLNELGIFRFDQIADMSEYDIDRVANRLRGFRSRIYREDWIGQARDLRDQQADA